MSDFLEITEADLKRFAPKARREYVTAILGKLSSMRQAGILENSHRWCHFMAQVGHETGGLTILRESLRYTTAKRLREVWPARFRNKTDLELAPLLNNPVALGDAVYLGRMGNRIPGDGCAFRGAGCMQTTGRAAVVKYAKAMGLDPVPALLDDVNVTTEFAIIEWQEAGCNELADTNDIVAVSRAINTGSAQSGVEPVGLDGRREWFAKAWSIWGDKGKPDKAHPSVTAKDVAKKWLPIGVGGGVGVSEIVGALKDGVPAVPDVATKSLENVGAWKGIAKSVWGLGSEGIGAVLLIGKAWPFVLVAGLAGGGLVLMRLRRRRHDQTG